MLHQSSVDSSKIEENFLTTGCSKLDLFLRGGIIYKGITQIYGESGVGKTQLALQLCLSAQIPLEKTDNIGGTAYVCTEAAFPSRRLQELLKKSSIRNKCNLSSEVIFIEHISDTNDLEDCICNSNRLEFLLSKHNIRLLIIDSIAATYRLDSELNNLRNRAKSLRKLGYHLQKLASTYKIAIVCINQVTSIIKNSSQYVFSEENPSLGIIWASMITNSIYLYKKYNRRYLHIAGSSYLPKKTIEYEISESGFVVK